MDYNVSTDDLFRVIGEKDVQIKVCEARVAQLEAMLASEPGPEMSSDTDTDAALKPA